MKKRIVKVSHAVITGILLTLATEAIGGQSGDTFKLTEGPGGALYADGIMIQYKQSFEMYRPLSLLFKHYYKCFDCHVERAFIERMNDPKLVRNFIDSMRYQINEKNIKVMLQSTGKSDYGVTGPVQEYLNEWLDRLDVEAKNK
ncbi:MAG: hypothetical protein F9K48_04620 [Candidatus Brocadia sp.]|nr:MAG: hypothetical protein F9K48_04620 [Candidatus Brocadia sp.]